MQERRLHKISELRRRGGDVASWVFLSRVPRVRRVLPRTRASDAGDVLAASHARERDSMKATMRTQRLTAFPVPVTGVARSGHSQPNGDCPCRGIDPPTDRMCCLPATSNQQTQRTEQLRPLASSAMAHWGTCPSTSTSNFLQHTSELRKVYNGQLYMVLYSIQI